MRYRLLVGSHEDTVKDGEKWTLKQYHAGDVVESDLALDKLFLNKFVAEGGESFGAPKQNPMAALKGLRNASVEELQQIAADEEVDVTACITREDYLKAVLEHSLA